LATSNRLQKAPIYNPYDKFTQNEFDTWIGGITGALRKALGQEGDGEEQESATQDFTSDLFAPREDDGTEQTPAFEPEAQSEAEDSFAETKARVDKGKGRDPREGPGLGGKLQPIELLYSDSDEEDGGEEGEEEIEDDEVDEDGEYDWRVYDSEGNGHSDYEGSEEEYGEEASGHGVRDNSPEDIIEVSSGEEEEGQGPSEDVFEGSGSPDTEARYTLSIAKFGQPLPPPDDDEDAHGEEEEAEYQEDELQYPQYEEDNQSGFWAHSCSDIC
jgi:hypothetical protein